MSKHRSYRSYTLLYSGVAVIALFAFQIFSGKAGWAIANLFSYKRIDPDGIYAGISVHHFLQMIIALAIIIILSKLLKIDFGFNLGGSKVGIKYLLLFIAAYTIITLVSHVFMYIYHSLPVYNFPLYKTNMVGTLGFQLFLSGLSEEILYRALPVTVFAYIFGKSSGSNQVLTLEVIIASIMFAIAHTEWSLFPFVFKADYFQLLYAFSLGMIQGIAYQKSRSIVYPILMHI